MQNQINSSINHKAISYLLSFLVPFFFANVSCARSEEIQTATAFYLDSETGDDNNAGTSPEKAWKSLAKASEKTYKPNEKLLLCNGCTFTGTLKLNANGTKIAPVIVSTYAGNNGRKNRPVIDAKGYLAAIQVQNGSNFQIDGLELTSDGGAAIDTEAQTKRYGVHIVANQHGIYPSIHLTNLHIHHVFATESIPKDGQNPTSNTGMGIYIEMQKKDAIIKNVLIEKCLIEKTGHTGMGVNGFGDKNTRTYLDSVTIVNNELKHIGGPGMVPRRCQNLIVNTAVP